MRRRHHRGRQQCETTTRRRPQQRRLLGNVRLEPGYVCDMAGKACRKAVCGDGVSKAASRATTRTRSWATAAAPAAKPSSSAWSRRSHVDTCWLQLVAARLSATRATRTRRAALGRVERLRANGSRARLRSRAAASPTTVFLVSHRLAAFDTPSPANGFAAGLSGHIADVARLERARCRGSRRCWSASRRRLRIARARDDAVAALGGHARVAGGRTEPARFELTRRVAAVLASGLPSSQVSVPATLPSPH